MMTLGGALACVVGKAGSRSCVIVAVAGPQVRDIGMVSSLALVEGMAASLAMDG